MKNTVLFALVFLINITNAQNFVWAKDIGSFCVAAASNTAGDVYTTGNTYGVVDFDPGPGTFTAGTGNTNIYISRSNAAGNFISACAMPLNGGGTFVPYAIKVDAAGNIYITGKYYIGASSIIDFDPGPGTYTAASISNQPVCFILKLDPAYNFLWVKSLEGSGGGSVGTAITTDASGNVLTGGYYDGSTDFDPGVSTFSSSSGGPTISNGFLLKLNSAGNFVSLREIAGTSSVVVNAIGLGPSGDVHLTGYYHGTADFDPGAATNTLASAGGSDIFALKLDAAGNFIWAKSMGGPGNNFATSIVVDALGSPHLTGSTSGNADFDPGPATYAVAPLGAKDIFTLKLDVSGNFLWVKTIGNSLTPSFYQNIGNSIDVDAWGNVYTTGSFHGAYPFDFDPGPGTFLLGAPSSSYTSFISELDGSGNFIWAGKMGEGEGRTVIVYNQSVYDAGNIYGPAPDVDPTAGTYSLAGFNVGFILKLDISPTISGPPLVCNANTGTATGVYSVYDLPGSTYTWTAPGATLNTSPNTWSVNLTLAPGSTTILVTIGNSSTITSTRTLAVNVAVTPTLTTSVSPSASVCAGSTISLGASGASSYTWTGGIVNNTSFSLSTSGTYSVTGTTTAGCTATRTVAVVAYTVPGIAAFTTSFLPTYCSGSAVTLSFVTTGITSHTWNPVATTGAPFNVTSSAVYTITGTASNGCAASSTVGITVTPIPTITITAAPSATVCAGSTLNLSGSGGVGTYTWSGGITDNVAFAPSSNAVYTVSGSSGAANCTGTATVGITVNPLPVVTASILPSLSVCIGSTLNLSGTGASTYTWSGGILNNTAFTPATSSVYIVAGTDINGCINAYTVNTVVNPLPVIGTSVIPSPSVCAGSSLTLNGTGASNYSWSGGVTNGLTFTAAASAVYTVTGTDANGCNSTATVSTLVYPLPLVGGTVLPSPTVCAGSTLNLGGTGALAYSWTGGITNNVTFTATASSVYTVTGTDIYTCKNTGTVSVTVNPLPVLGYTAVPSLTVCAGSALTLNAGGALNYMWGNGVTNGVSFVPPGTAIYNLNGIDANGCSNNLSLTVVVNPQPTVVLQPLSQTVAVASSTQFVVSSSNAGATFQWQQNTGSGFVNLSNGGQFSGVTTATLVLANATLGQNNNDFRCIASQGNCTDTSTIARLTVLDFTGIMELRHQNQFRVSPNPATNRCTIYVSNPSAGLTYSITDQSGRLVLSGELTGTSTELDLNSLAAGFYIVRIDNCDQRPVKLMRQ